MIHQGRSKDPARHLSMSRFMSRGFAAAYWKSLKIKGTNLQHGRDMIADRKHDDRPLSA